MKKITPLRRDTEDETYHALLVQGFVELLLETSHACRHLEDLGASERKFGKLTNKKGRDVTESRSEVMVHDELNQEDMVQIFL